MSTWPLVHVHGLAGFVGFTGTKSRFPRSRSVAFGLVCFESQALHELLQLALFCVRHLARGGGDPRYGYFYGILHRIFSVLGPGLPTLVQV